MPSGGPVEYLTIDFQDGNQIAGALIRELLQRARHSGDAAAVGPAAEEGGDPMAKSAGMVPCDENGGNAMRR